MKGLDLARAYWRACAPALLAEIPDEMRCASVGLAGEGSECFGFDDEASRDHDFGPRLCIWLPDELYRECGVAVQRAYDALPAHFLGFVRPDSSQGGKRSGAFPVGGYFAQFIGRTEPPQTLREWLALRQEDAAVASNGEVFYDECESFQRFRSVLRAYYPEDVRRKKIAAQIALAAQSGQYNLPRSLKRGDTGAAALCCAEFAQAAIRAAHLLSHVYAPFYKWAFRSLRELELAPLADLLERAVQNTVTGEVAGASEAVEEACSLLAHAMRAQGMAAAEDGFLLRHAQEAQESIADDDVRRLPLMYG